MGDLGLLAGIEARCTAARHPLITGDGNVALVCHRIEDAVSSVRAAIEEPAARRKTRQKPHAPSLDTLQRLAKAFFGLDARLLPSIPVDELGAAIRAARIGSSRCVPPISSRWSTRPPRWAV